MNKHIAALRPVNDRILVRPIEKTSSGGIVLSQATKSNELHGTVLAVGDGRQKATGERLPIDCCKVGDDIVYGNVANTVKDNIGGKEVHLIVEQAVVAVIEYEAAGDD